MDLCSKSTAEKQLVDLWTVQPATPETPENPEKTPEMVDTPEKVPKLP